MNSRCSYVSSCGRKSKCVHKLGVAIANRCTSLSRIPQFLIHIKITLPASFPSSFVFPKTIGTVWAFWLVFTQPSRIWYAYTFRPISVQESIVKARTILCPRMYFGAWSVFNEFYGSIVMTLWNQDTLRICESSNKPAIFNQCITD